MSKDIFYLILYLLNSQDLKDCSLVCKRIYISIKYKIK